jgi:hypothetical protein
MVVLSSNGMTACIDWMEKAAEGSRKCEREPFRRFFIQ